MLLFKDLLQKFFAMSEATSIDVIKLIGDFCGVSKDVVISWISETAVPRGIVLIKLREIFVGAGCTFSEYERIPDPFKDISILLAYDIINIKDNPYLKMGIPFKDDFMRPITGDRIPGKERLKKVAQFCAVFDEEIFQAKDARPERFKIIQEICSAMDTNEVVQPTVDAQAFKKLLSSVDNIITVLSPLAETLVNGTAGERLALRELINAEDRKKLFNISNNLYNFSKSVESLCGEDARSRNLAERKKSK